MRTISSKRRETSSIAPPPTAADKPRHPSASDMYAGRARGRPRDPHATANGPSSKKPLLPVGDRSLLERVFDTVAGVVDEFVVVVGYRGDAIRDAIGESYRVISVHYVEQAEALGTAHAVAQVEPSSTTTSSCSTATWSWMHRFPAPLPTPRGQQSRPRRSSILGHTVCSRRPRTVHSPDRREARRPADESRERRLLRVYARGLRVYR